MKNKQPTTRIEATAPDATKHLNHGQQTALELGEEAEHSTGIQKEKLIKKATRLANTAKPQAEH